MHHHATTTYIALFRGINVGGRHILPMKELVALLKGIGLQGVSTYIQSGNAVFRSPDSDTVALAERIRTVVEDARGFRPEVLLLTLDELEDVIAANPFPEAEADPRTLHVSFLASVPTDPDHAALEALRGEHERYVLRGKAFFLHAPDGIGRSRLAASAERHLGVVATARNWRSVCEIRTLAVGRP